MFTPQGGRQRARILLIALFAAAIAAVSSPAGTTAASHGDGFPLRSGSAGPRVAALQWLLSGRRPNTFTKVKPTLHRYTKGVQGARTDSALVAYKYRVGYPKKGECGARATTLTPTASRYFFELLLGHRQRPICWVALAQQRLQIVEPGVSKSALAIKQLELSQLGVHEIPDGSNRGPCISYTCRLGALGMFGPYQGATGAYAAPWCASLQQWAFDARTGAYFADRSAGVFYIEGWAQKHGYLNAKAKVGSLVAFLDDGGHIGYVIKVTAAGYATVEGNEGNAVHEVWHPWNDRLRVFIDLPGVA